MNNSVLSAFIGPQYEGFENSVAYFKCKNAYPLTKAMSDVLGLSEQRCLELIELGSVFINKQRTFDHTFEIQNENDLIRVHTKPKRYPFTVDDIQNSVIADEDDFVIFYKPAKLPVHATVDNWNENLLYLGSRLLNCELHITHRIDRETSGLIVYAKNKKFQNHFNQGLRSRSLTKKYWCEVALGKLTPGIFEHEIDGKNCLFEILKVMTKENSQELIIRLITGRTHQIRRQLQILGFPIAGDEKYGGPKNKQLQLESCYIEFEDFAGEKRHFSTPRFSNNA